MSRISYAPEKGVSFGKPEMWLTEVIGRSPGQRVHEGNITGADRRSLNSEVVSSSGVVVTRYGKAWDMATTTVRADHSLSSMFRCQGSRLDTTDAVQEFMPSLVMLQNLRLHLHLSNA